MEDESSYIFVDDFRYCKACLKNYENEYKEENVPESLKCVGVREILTKKGMLIPTPWVQYENCDPSLTRRFDSLTSTERRINQGADQVEEARKKRISETEDSQKKCINLVSKFKKLEQTTCQLKKPKACLHSNPSDTGICLLFRGNSLNLPTTDSYRRIMQAAKLINYEKYPRPVTYADFKPKVKYPFDYPENESPDCAARSPGWMKHQKQISHFTDSEVPKRYGYYKFMDDDRPTL